MFIKEVVIDGFKSYAQRTVISGFDQLFNAITGLNGSGKSNILDAICFLLGITNLSQVRATNLQELVYKNGQAGVTKASVTVTWDNADKKHSPVGYEAWDEIVVTRQVVIGGRNKYLINGVNATNQRVQDLFRSVQLNVNNPHFLIMQGRITKVMNMKPPEILSMIEEAAGTKMYETKKASAERTVEKKETKLQEINTILAEEITPTLTKLKEERSAYMEYTKLQREVEYLTKLYIAFQFVTAEATRDSSAQQQAEVAEHIATLKRRMGEIDGEVKKSVVEMRELEKKKEAESNSGLKQLEDNFASASKVVAKAESMRDNCRSSMTAERRKQKEVSKGITDAEGQQAGKQKEVSKLESQLEKLRDASDKDASGLQQAKKHFEAISQGLSSADDGQVQTLAEQLMGFEEQVSSSKTEREQATARLKAAQEDVKGQQAKCKAYEQEYTRDTAALDDVKKAVAKMKANLGKIGFDPAAVDKMTAERDELHHECDRMRTDLQRMEASFPRLSFDYKDPERSFDRRKVRGKAAKLISVPDERHATALEVAAGAKLYNVVVSDEVVAKQLLDKGQLRMRTTFLPLNKIQSHPVSADTVRRAQQLVGKENVDSALALVKFAPVDRPAMEFIFGSVLVCRTSDHAKKVCFDPQIRCKTVSWDGDLFDPSGTLSGGSRPTGNSSVLVRLQAFSARQADFDAKAQRVQQLNSQLEMSTSMAANYQKMSEEVFLKEREIEQVQQRIESSTHHQQLEKLKELQRTIDGTKTAVEQTKETEKKAVAKCKEIQEKMKDAKKFRERELKAAEQGVTKAKTKSEESLKQLKAREQESEELKLEAESLSQDVDGLRKQLAGMEETLKLLQKELEEHQATVDGAKASAKEAEGLVKDKRKALQEFSKEISRCAEDQKNLEKEKNEATISLKELEHSIGVLLKESKEAAHNVQVLKEKHEWIALEREFFGQPNTAFDFEANDPVEAGRRLSKLQEKKDKLSKSVNMRAMNMLGKAEEKYQDLMKKKKIVEEDKAKIARVIEELDEKKSEALLTAYQQVNKDFCSIFGSLLPGSKARLTPPEGMTVLDGLEFRVAFGDVWKDNLSELSGGQRSLVALSLILAMLLFKPAPLYILDEIDAALDLSHTQNIGQMLRTHFRNSQFVVVSLKDGMFNNANVLFKTKFVDGVSTVTRHVQSSSSHHAAAATAKSSSSSKRAKIR
ncbi:structural maintenance of chromosomes protein 2-like [Sycon ciliatum]|uniref:structural maintenance of chromosomes protein 2-like n=1 Tax=Sycon ciliatum TaxID=27933 RepID=UPI0031F62730